MLEIILTLSLYTNTLLDKPIEIKQTNKEFIVETKHKILVNNKKSDKTLDLKEGENKLTVISENNDVLEHLLIITQPKICNYLDAKILEADYETDLINLHIPSNCLNELNNFELFVDSPIEIKNLTIKTNLVSTSEGVILLYKNKIIDYKCWINEKISKTELKDFEKFKLNKENCSIKNNNSNKNTNSDNIKTNKTDNLSEKTREQNLKTQTIKEDELKINKTDNISETISKQNLKTQTIEEDDLKIVSAMPNSEIEFVEIENLSNKILDLSNTYLSDKTTQIHNLSGSISPKQKLKIKDLTFTLNNKDETINLINKATKEIIDSISYKSSEENGIVRFSKINKDNNTNKKTSKEGSEETQVLNHIIITEIHPNPQGDERTQEFIEIYNPNDSKIPTNKYELRINNKSIQLPKTLDGKSYWSTKETSISNTKATIELTYNNKTLQTYTATESIEDISYINIENNWVQTLLKSREKENGIIENYQGELEVRNNVFIINDKIITQGIQQLEDGKYKKANLDIHYLENKAELIKIREIEQHYIEKRENKEEKKDITSMGILSMASLAVVYNFIK